MSLSSTLTPISSSAPAEWFTLAGRDPREPREGDLAHAGLRQKGGERAVRQALHGTIYRTLFYVAKASCCRRHGLSAITPHIARNGIIRASVR